MTCQRGSVVLTVYPNSDLRTLKKRPALIVQDRTVHTGLQQVVLAMITSNVSRTCPTRVRVNQHSAAGKQMKLFADSMTVCDVLQTVAEIAV